MFRAWVAVRRSTILNLRRACVAQLFKLLFRRFLICGVLKIITTSEVSTRCRLKTCETAAKRQIKNLRYESS